MDGFSPQNGFFGLSGLGPGGASGPVAQALDALNAHPAVLATWNPFNPDPAFVSSSRSAPVQVTEGGLLGTAYDQKGSLGLIATPDDAARGTWNAAGPVFGSGKNLVGNFTFGGVTAYAYMGLFKGTTGGNLVIGHDSTPGILIANSASSTNPAGQMYVDGAALSPDQYNTLHTAITDGALHTIENRGFVGGEDIRITGAAGDNHAPLVLFNNGHADLAAAILLAQLYVEALTAAYSLGE
jgi:hypothetical protein